MGTWPSSRLAAALWLFLPFVGFSTTCSPANAVTVFTDRALFETAFSGGPTRELVTEVFDVPATLPIPDNVETSVGLFSVFDAASLSGNRVENATGPNASMPNFLDDFLGLAADSGGLELRFANPISFFGADFAALRIGGGLSLRGAGFADISIEDAFGGERFGFFGVELDTPVSTLILRAPLPSNDLDAIALDNVEFDRPAVAVGDVPEPATIGLLGLAALGLGAGRRRLRTVRSVSA